MKSSNKKSNTNQPFREPVAGGNRQIDLYEWAYERFLDPKGVEESVFPALLGSEWKPFGLQCEVVPRVFRPLQGIFLSFEEDFFGIPRISD